MPQPPPSQTVTTATSRQSTRANTSTSRIGVQRPAWSSMGWIAVPIGRVHQWREVGGGQPEW